MSDMESMSKMILAMMQVVRKQESIENQQKEQKVSATKCLQAILTKKGQFDGQNVTKYLKGYFTETMIYKINGETAVREFPTLVEPKLKRLVEALAATTTGSEAWLIFEQRMKEEFQLEDTARVTQATFLDWISERNKKLGPQELLREFNRRFIQLPAHEAQVIKLQRATLLLKAADDKLRDELETAIDPMEPARVDSEYSWAQIEKAAMKVSHRHRRRELDQEAISRRPDTASASELKEVKSGIPDEMADLMKTLSMLAMHALDVPRQQPPTGGGRPPSRPKSPGPGSSQNQNWRCMWCDSEDHTKRECQELTEAARSKMIKFVGEPGMNKIAYYDTEEPIPLNTNRGGMKALVEKRIKEQEGASAAFAEANVYSLGGQQMEEGLSEAQKKRLAEEMRQRTGWDDPLFISPITAGVSDFWDTQVHANRRTKPDYNKNQKREDGEAARKEGGSRLTPTQARPQKRRTRRRSRQ
ncbi:unnamed protein product [Calypogeia fissa]